MKEFHIIFALCATGVGCARGADWPNWRGPYRNGSARLHYRMTPEKATLLWQWHGQKGFRRGDGVGGRTAVLGLIAGLGRGNRVTSGQQKRSRWMNGKDGMA
jgi:hypothetical protein